MKKSFKKGDLAIFNSDGSPSAKKYSGISNRHFGSPVVVLHPLNTIQSAWILLDGRNIFVSYDYLIKEEELTENKRKDLVESWFFETE